MSKTEIKNIDRLGLRANAQTASEEIYMAEMKKIQEFTAPKTIKAVNFDHPDSGCSGHVVFKNCRVVNDPYLDLSMEDRLKWHNEIFGPRLNDEDISPVFVESRLHPDDDLPKPTPWQRIRAWFA